MNLVNYLSESKKNSLVDNFILLIFFLFPISFLSSALLNFFLIIISVYFFYYVFKNNYFSWIKNESVKIILILWVYILINSLINYNSIDEVQKSFFYLRYIVFFISIVYILPKLNINFKNLFFIYLLISTFFSFDIIIQFFFEKNIFGLPCLMNCQRNSSFFGNELIAGSFIFYIGFISLIFFNYSENKKNFFVFFILFLISVFLTGDRTPFFMSLLILFLLLIFCKKFINFLLPAILFLIILSFFLFSSDKIYKRYYSNTFNMFQTSEISMVSLKWWHDQFNQQYLFLKNISTDGYKFSQSDESKYFQLGIDKLITDDDETKILKNLNFFEIIQNKNYISILSKKILKENNSIEKRLDNLIRVNLIRRSNNTENKWYNFFLDSQYGSHYLTAFNIFLDNPIFGSGLKSFRIKCEEYDNINTVLISSRCSTHPHNTHLEILSELGILGYLIFIIMFFSILKIAFKNIKNYRVPHFLMLSMIIVIFIPFRPSGSFFSSINATFFWISFSMFFLLNELNKK